MVPNAIEIVEVAPRDGLQNEKVAMATADKLALIARAIAAGARRIEVTSFVNPRAVPQMADAEAVATAGTVPASGAKNMASRNSAATTSAVSPVRPPACTPAALST